MDGQENGEAGGVMSSVMVWRVTRSKCRGCCKQVGSGNDGAVVGEVGIDVSGWRCRRSAGDRWFWLAVGDC